MEKALETETISSVATLHKDDVVESSGAQPQTNEKDPKTAEDEIPLKKRKTRRGKSKRRNIHPYKTDMKTKLIKPEAPYNSNRFLIEDHGNIEELDERLKNVDQLTNSTVTRTRDSSFSVDSDGEFYSTPDDEEEFLIKDFDDQYESLQTERLHSMSKNELIQEYLQLENKVEVLTKRLRLKSGNYENGHECNEEENNTQLNYKEEINRLTTENEALKRENDTLKNKLSQSCSSDSEDSETDSSDSCSSSTSTSSMSRPESPQPDYSRTNGHSTVVGEV